MIINLNIFDSYDNYYNWYKVLFDTKSTLSVTISGYENIILQKVYILYNFIFNILPYCITNINRRHFGLYDTIGEHKAKYNSIAIPFQAAQTPNITSEFSNIDITLCFTIISYLLNQYILRKGDYDEIINGIYKLSNSMNSSEFQEHSAKRKYDLITLSLIGKKDVDISKYYKYDDIIAYGKELNVSISEAQSAQSQPRYILYSIQLHSII